MGEGVLGIHENDRHNHRDTYTGIHPHSFIHYTTLSFFPFSHNHALFFHAITQIRKGFSRHRAHKNNLSQITHGGRLRKHVIIFFIFAQSRNNKGPFTQSRIPMGDLKHAHTKCSQREHLKHTLTSHTKDMACHATAINKRGQLVTMAISPWSDRSLLVATGRIQTTLNSLPAWNRKTRL